MKTPQHITALLKPTTDKPADRRAWSIPIAGVWQPFFLATNAAGETAIPSEALGAPLRLGKEKDGSIKFSPSGRPVLRVVKELSDQVRLVRENFAASLMLYTGNVHTTMKEEYRAEVTKAQAAGKPLVEADQAALDAYVQAVKAAQATTEPAAPAPDRELVAA